LPPTWSDRDLLGDGGERGARLISATDTSMISWAGSLGIVERARSGTPPETQRARASARRARPEVIWQDRQSSVVLSFLAGVDDAVAQ
jgi:hypothetical protein